MLDLIRIKRHLNLDADYLEEDDYLLSLLEVATITVFNHINASEDIPTNPPEPINQAILLLIGNLYSNREVITDGKRYEVPKAYEYLLIFYKNY